jgi:hypothetical protein
MLVLLISPKNHRNKSHILVEDFFLTLYLTYREQVSHLALSTKDVKINFFGVRRA